MSARMNLENLEHLGPGDEVKFVIQSYEDYFWTKQILANHPTPPPEKVLLSPAHPILDPRDLAQWILADRLPARLQIPMHRGLWPEATRGR